MSVNLPDVHVGSPHTKAHNDERHASIAISDQLDNLEQIVSDNYTGLSQSVNDALSDADSKSIDLTDFFSNATNPQAAIGKTLNVTLANAAISAPALPTSVGVPVAHWAVKNRTNSNVTVTYPNDSGTTVTSTMLPDEAKIFRQKNTSGWGTESGSLALAQLDLRYLMDAGEVA